MTEPTAAPIDPGALRAAIDTLNGPCRTKTDLDASVAAIDVLDGAMPTVLDLVDRLTAERDQKAAALARVLAEYDASWAAADCYGDGDVATRDLVARIRAAIEEPTQ
ncbi:hypothetical protein B4N89_27440 [Embleya scabrispora]|uniref:Uncharacterized protein n=1 Tax=Embleya scabrispora TaxID=159449 RepID=A0A1T3P593_9ACTN|nr:hypothetical protein [Embleya scabrispora]OPC84162.1 hypothetical protein B4N89_27440 [Embleya scabrispora]